MYVKMLESVKMYNDVHNKCWKAFKCLMMYITYMPESVIIYMGMKCKN